MRSFFVVFFFLHFFAFVNSQYSVCSGDEYATTRVESINACGSGSCSARMGSNIETRFTLNPKVDSQKLIVKGYVKKWWWKFDVPGLSSDGCSIKGLGCPLLKGKTYNGVFSVVVPWVPFPVSGTIHIEIINENGQILSCLTADGSIYK